MGAEKPNVEAIFHEFPFLEKHYRKNMVRSAKVERVDLGITNQVVLGNSDCGDSSYAHRDIRIFDVKGNLLERVGFLKRRCFWSRGVVDHVWDALVRAGESAHYVVQCLRTGGGNDITLCKPPKGWAVREWLEEQTRQAQEEVRATVRAFDLEGTL